VKLADESAAWTIHGLVHPTLAAPGYASVPLPRAVNEVARCGAALIVRTGATPARTLVAQPRESASVLSGIEAASQARWHAASVEAAEPQVFAATSGEFVAQMLNLDVLGAIAFDKGCYTGQEVIARAHYRGRVKRRLQRFVTDVPAVLRPGDAGELTDGRTVKVVDAVQRSDGRCEFLGIAGFAADDSEVADPATAATRAGQIIAAQPLPMPYALPR